jgi:hypothetical protein
MKFFKRKYVLGTLLLVLLAWIVGNALTQPGVQDLPGDFRETALYRNENNTGPIIRVYAVTLSDTLWSSMEQYGTFMPHTKYGNTRVYFFQSDGPYPTQLAPGEQPFAPTLQPHCLALFEKDAMGNVSFRKYPFR